MTDLEKLKSALDALGVPYEEKRFKVTTAIVLTADDKAIHGRLGNFCEFKFENEADDEGTHDKYMNCGVYVCMASEDQLRKAQQERKELSDAEQDMQQDQQQLENQGARPGTTVRTVEAGAGSMEAPEPPKKKRTFAAPPRKVKS